MRLTENIYLLAGVSYGTLGNVYGIVYRDGLVMIDCGRPDEAVPVIEENLRAWHLDGLPVTHLLITHGHPDHCANALYFQKKGTVVIAGGKDARQIIRLGDYDPQIFPCVLHDFEEDCLFEPCEVDVQIDEDCSFAIGDLAVEVILTPGHTQGSVVYMIGIKGKRYMFSGDTLSISGSRGTVPILGTSASVDYCGRDYIASMQKLLNCYPDGILGGHGFPRFGACNRIVASACMKAMAERS